MIFHKNNKKGIALIGVIVAMTILSAITIGFTQWYMSLNSSVNMTGERMEEMSIAYDKWNQIISEDFDSLIERIADLPSKKETETIGGKYDLTVTYGSEGKFEDGKCVSGTPEDETQKCVPVSISVTKKDSSSGLGLNVKPYSLATTRIASQGGGSSDKVHGNTGVITANTSWTVPKGVKQISVTASAGGGGGGGFNASWNSYSTNGNSTIIGNLVTLTGGGGGDNSSAGQEQTGTGENVYVYKQGGTGGNGTPYISLPAEYAKYGQGGEGGSGRGGYGGHGGTCYKTGFVKLSV